MGSVVIAWALIKKQAVAVRQQVHKYQYHN